MDQIQNALDVLFNFVKTFGAFFDKKFVEPLRATAALFYNKDHKGLDFMSPTEGASWGHAPTGAGNTWAAEDQYKPFNAVWSDATKTYVHFLDLVEGKGKGALSENGQKVFNNLYWYTPADAAPAEAAAESGATE